MLRRDFIRLGFMAAATPLLPRSAGFQESGGLSAKQIRGLMIDAARLPEKPSYYRRVIDFCSEWKVNTVLFRLTDDQGSAFHFENHPELVTHDHALTPAEARELAAYAQRRAVTLIPEIETFGHTSYITSTPQWAHLADTPPGTRSEFVGICPVHPETRKLVADLIHEVAAIFPSALLHVGCDEVNWGGSELSQQALAKRSRAEIWADYLNWLDGVCKEAGKEMIVWGDFVAHKEPAILEHLNKRVIVMDWQYYVTDPQPLIETASQITGRGLRVIGAPALVTCEWGPRPGVEVLANVDAYVNAYSGERAGAMGVIVTNWVPGRFMANALWDCFAYAAVSMEKGADAARSLGLRRFVERFYGARWDAAWDEAFQQLYSSTPGRTCTRAWHRPRLPLPSISDREVESAAAAKALDPAPYAALAAKIRALAPKVHRNMTEFASFLLTADYIAHVIWREAQWPKLHTAQPEEAKKLVAETASRDGEIAKRVDDDWNVARFEDDRWKRERLANLTPYDQLLLRLQEAAAYSAELAGDTPRLLRLLERVKTTKAGAEVR